MGFQTIAYWPTAFTNEDIDHPPPLQSLPIDICCLPRVELYIFLRRGKGNRATRSLHCARFSYFCCLLPPPPSLSLSISLSRPISSTRPALHTNTPRKAFRLSRFRRRFLGFFRRVPLVKENLTKLVEVTSSLGA